jgi:hypothetical protein
VVTAVAARAATEADRRVAAVRDDPKGRLELARASYEGDSVWCRAEQAFMEWEVERGVLNPLDADEPGSPWWRTVNEALLRDTEEARVLTEGGVTAGGSNPGVDRWLEFMGAPSSLTWYRAHNTSVARGYVDAASLAVDESTHEQKLMNLTLMRVLFAHVMEEDTALGLGPFAHIGRYVADPRSFGIDAIVKVPDFYPRHYPLDEGDEHRMDHRRVSFFAAFLAAVDDELVLPRLEELYAFGARVLNVPALLNLAFHGVPCYPWGLLTSRDRLSELGLHRHRPSFVLPLLRRLFAREDESVDGPAAAGVDVDVR